MFSFDLTTIALDKRLLFCFSTRKNNNVGSHWKLRRYNKCFYHARFEKVFLEGSNTDVFFFFDFFFDEGRRDDSNTTTISRPSSARQQNAI